MTETFLITCEHGGNRIPPPYKSLFRGCRALLESHRGYDPGALFIAQELAQAFKAPLVSATVSRLLIDLNRSIGHPRLFSAQTRGLPPEDRNTIVEQHYRPYRLEAERHLRQLHSRGRPVIHISSHSFTPELDGKQRTADVGLLYNPARPGESDLCSHWKASLASLAPQLRVRRNYPYAGKGDGLASYFRSCFPPEAYIGIELEINQAIIFAGGRPWKALRSALIHSLQTACDTSTASTSLNTTGNHHANKRRL